MPRETVMPLRGRVLAPLVGFFLLFDLIIATWIPNFGSLAGGIILGGVFAQITLLALWTALGFGPVFLRVALGTIGAAVAMLSLLFCLVRLEIAHEVFGVLGGLCGQWICVQGPLWLLRYPFGWRIGWPQAPVAASDELQFGLRQLLIWTTICGVLLAAVRLIPAEITEVRGEGLWIMGLLLVWNTLFAFPIIWAGLVRGGMLGWFVAAAICGCGITLAEIWTFHRALGGVQEAIFWYMNGIQFVALSASLLGLRGAGVRLIRPASGGTPFAAR